MTPDEITGWFRGRVPDTWFEGPLEVVADRDEVLVVGTLPTPDLGDDLGAEARDVALAARIAGFRGETRDHRIAIAREAEHRFGRKVAWGARCGERTEHFTTASVPVMTRLRLAERQVLDTLIDAGVARSRSEALAWCVRLVGQHEADWLGELREAMAHVRQVRDRAPS